MRALPVVVAAVAALVAFGCSAAALRLPASEQIERKESVDDDLLLSSQTILGLRADFFRYLLCLLLGYPLAFALRRIPSSTHWGPTLRHVFSGLGGIAFGLYCFGISGVSHAALSSSIVYVIVTCTNLPQRHWLGFAVGFGYTLMCHIFRMVVNPDGVWELDFTGPQMVLAMKLSSFSLAIYDGTSEGQREAATNVVWTKSRSPRMLTKPPSVLEYFGFVYFFPTYLCGPSCDMKEYLDFVNGTIYGNDTEASQLMSSVAPALSLLPLVLVYGVCIVLEPYLSFSAVVEDWWVAKPIWYKYVWILACGPIWRAKFYVGWLMSHGACIMAGISYSGGGAWDRMKNVDIPAVEFAGSPRDLSVYWNMRSGLWLRVYVYERLPSYAHPMYTTMLTSAVWHGFFPGYFLTFASGALMIDVARRLRSHLRKAVYPSEGSDAGVQQRSPSQWLYEVLSIFMTMATWNYLTLAFFFLDLRKVFQIWATLWYIPHVVAFVLLAFYMAGGARMLKLDKRKD